MANVQLEGFVDASAVLKAGVYALVKNGVVIYVGKSKSVYQRIYTHRHMARKAAKGQTIPSWLPAKGFVFDQVFVRTCTVDKLDALEVEIINTYKPRYNESLKTNAKVKIETPLRIGTMVLNLNSKPEGEGIRRI
jgi:excinuclease UvrABC nuclease subunit